jgi:CheY-like chemotaxis protein
MPLLYRGITPVLKKDITDENLIVDLYSIETIVTTWPQAKLFVFSQFRDSPHLSLEQKQVIEEFFQKRGIHESQIISKDPLDQGLRSVVGRIAAAFDLPIAKPHRDATALVVEDIGYQRDAIEARLQEEGITVYAASGRKEALEILKEYVTEHDRLPNCIITDLYMPPEREKAGTKLIDEIFNKIMSRLDSFESLRKGLARVPIVVFSLYAVSDKLDGPQVKAIEQRLDDLNIPKENRIIKTGRFRERLEQVVKRVLAILEDEQQGQAPNE